MTDSTPGLFATRSLGQFAEKWARGIADVLEQEFPAVNMHISTSADDCDVRPRTQHPSFWGCFDWHSSVHMQYSAVRLLSEEKLSSEASTRLHNILEQRWDKQSLQAEYDYLVNDPSFEQPYGRAWLLQLARRSGREEFLPLVELTEKHIMKWVSALSHPIRHGMHYNTAFNLFLMLDAAQAMGRVDSPMCLPTPPATCSWGIAITRWNGSCRAVTSSRMRCVKCCCFLACWIKPNLVRG